MPCASSASDSDPARSIRLASDAPRAEVILGNSDRAYTFGVNWYVNRWVKIQANLVRNTIDFPDQGPIALATGFLEPLVRFQFSM